MIDSDGFELLQIISTNSLFKNFYLVGGTELSLLIGHRKSVDLDFFSNHEFKSNLLDNFNYQKNTSQNMITLSLSRS